MTVYGIALVKDELDIIESTVRHTAGQVDRLLVSDNASTDGTRDILARLAGELPLEVLDDPDPRHYQARKLTALAQGARERGADWVVPFDADEVWYSPFGRIADVLASTPDAWRYSAQLYDHVPTAEGLGWRRRHPGELLKVACRTDPLLNIHEGSHSADYAGDYRTTVDGQLVIRHFPHRSVSQFVSKVRNGARGRNATDLPGHVSTHLRELGRVLERKGLLGLEAVFNEEYWVENPEANPALIYDPAP